MAITYTKAEIDEMLAPLLISHQSSLQIEGIWNWTGYGQPSPSWGQVSADAAPTNATELYFHKNDAYGKEFTAIMAMLTEHCQVWAQSVTDSQAWIKLQCGGAPTQVGDVITVSVTLDSSGPNLVENWTQVRALFIAQFAHTA